MAQDRRAFDGVVMLGGVRLHFLYDLGNGIFSGHLSVTRVSKRFQSAYLIMCGQLMIIWCNVDYVRFLYLLELL